MNARGKRYGMAAAAAILWLATSAAAVAAGAAAPVDESGRDSVITVDASVLARLREDGAPVIDVRRPDEWQATGIIPGSRLITAFDAHGRSVPGFLAEVEAAVGRDRPLVLICRSGNRSAMAARLLTGEGYRPVYNVAGGIGAWSAAGGSLVPCPTC